MSDEDIQLLIRVADLYIHAFTDDDSLTFTEAFMLTSVKDVVSRYDAEHA